MTPHKRIFLYGRSLILDALAASLRSEPGLDGCPLARPFPTPQAFSRLAPDVLLFDVQAAQPEAALALLQACPGLVLVGVDPESSQVTLWSGRRVCDLSTRQLVQLFQDERRKE